MPLLAVLLGGCADEPAQTAPPTLPTLPTSTSLPAVTDPSDWTFPGATEPGPVDLDGLSEALDAAVIEAISYPASLVVDAYDRRYARSANAACPAPVDDGLGNVYWSNGCSAADGTYFGGYLTRSVAEDLYSDDAGAMLDTETLSGNVVLVDPDGGTLDLEGTASVLTGQTLDGTTNYVQSFLVGGFALDAADASGWLGPMRSVEIAYTGVDIPSIGGRLLVVDGAVTPILGSDVYSARFTEATAANTAAGSACDREPGGTIGMRDPQGRWVEITFHGPVLDVTGGDPARCDGCGDAVSLPDGQPLGEVCADFGPWLTQEITP